MMILTKRKIHFALASVFLFVLYLIHISTDEINNPDMRMNRRNETLRQMQSKLSESLQKRVPSLQALQETQFHQLRSKQNVKTILYWNEFYGRNDPFNFGFGQEAFKNKRQCKSVSCFATNDRKLLPLEEFDAIIIHIRGLPNDWPEIRSSKQYYVMLSLEAPLYLYEYRNLNQLAFNWTMTYRMDSDFPVPFSSVDLVTPLPAPVGSSVLQRYIVKFGERAIRKGRNIAEEKIGFAVFFASNCHTSSQREVYLRELQKYIPVDVYGKCGDFECPKERGKECLKMAETKYKFYLAFEDAICRDYVTDRFFSAVGLDMIPVVLGGANYSALAPPHSFIDVRDYESPKALAHYLKRVDANDAKFNEFFWWRDYYRPRSRYHNAICDLCEQLHSGSKSGRKYTDMRAWWVDQGACQGGVLRKSWMNT